MSPRKRSWEQESLSLGDVLNFSRKMLSPAKDARDLGETVLDVDELDDIELQFYHRAVSRPDVPTGMVEDETTARCLETDAPSAACLRSLMEYSTRRQVSADTH